METVAKTTNFRQEFLWELSIPETQLIALAEAVPAESYSWRPAEDARTFSAVLVHIGAGNLLLLHLAGALTPDMVDLSGPIEGDMESRWKAMIRRGLFLERTLSEKTAVIDLLRRSFKAVRETFDAATEDELGKEIEFLGQTTTARRFYMRMLAHSHEHMGQAIAYVRTMGLRAPWPDPLKAIEGVEAKP
ncbi:MAG: DinB family protein [Terracidiphilus sp.]|jgi:uncharacterized damage-inducible protein DinB